MNLNMRRGHCKKNVSFSSNMCVGLSSETRTDSQSARYFWRAIRDAIRKTRSIGLYQMNRMQ